MIKSKVWVVARKGYTTNMAKKIVSFQGDDFSFTFKPNGDDVDPVPLVEIITHNRGGFHNTLTFRNLDYKQLKQIADFFNEAAEQAYGNISW